MFISQPIAPILMLVWPWQIVAIAAFIANVFWAIFIRYNVVIPAMRVLGCVLRQDEMDCVPTGGLPPLLARRQDRSSGGVPLAFSGHGTRSFSSTDDRQDTKALHAVFRLSADRTESIKVIASTGARANYYRDEPSGHLLVLKWSTEIGQER